MCVISNWKMGNALLIMPRLFGSSYIWWLAKVDIGIFSWYFGYERPEMLLYVSIVKGKHGEIVGEWEL